MDYKAVTDLVSQYVMGSDHPDLQVYRRDMVGEDRKALWYWRIRHFCDLGGFYNKRILEVGCGYGWDAVGLALIGGNEVVGCDILTPTIDGMTECLATMKTKGVDLPVTAVKGDICQLDMPAESFDGIFSTEAIEHVHDLGQMFDRCWQLLKPGGTAVLVNDSNRYNAGSRNHSWDSWDDRDNSWEHVNWLKAEVRPVEHADAQPYGVMREARIRAAAPDLSDGDVAKLRKATAGMIYPEIDEAVARFKRDGSLPTPDRFRWCRNPETGEYSERLLDPFELRDMLAKRGFEVKLRHLARKFPLKQLNGIEFKPLNKLLYARSPHFVLVAKKPLAN